jgi:hypothetical protein
MRYLVSVLFIIHGVVTSLQSAGLFKATLSTVTLNPAWLSWWPTNLGRSWLLSTTGLEKIPF